MEQGAGEEVAVQICQSDFANAMVRVFPSVSKLDELAYVKLQSSLRKERGHLEGSQKAPSSNPNGTPSIRNGSKKEPFK